MSVQAITCALALRGVTASEKLVLLALANYADENMRCFPSQKRISEDTCLTDRTLRTVLKALEDRKLVSRVERRRPDGSRSTDVITLHFSGEVTAQAEIISGGGEMVSGGVGKQLPGGGEMVSGPTTFEPPSNRQSECFADEIWALQPVAHRRSTRPDTRKAYAAAAKCGQPAEILAACQAYYRHPDRREDDGKFAMGAVRLLAADRWREFLPRPEPPAQPMTPQMLAHRIQHFRDTGEWRPTWGEMPKEIAA